MQPIATHRVAVPLTSAESTDGPARAPRVLFVSGDADFRAVVSRVLERGDYEVRSVAHSGHALLLCRTMRFDVVVTELCGPDVAGPALVEQLRRHCPGMTALYVANPGTPEPVENVVVRPFTSDDLIKAIEVALAAVVA
jgi:CheY-like chemotaxis protein